MRYWDNDFDRKFDKAVDELIKAEHNRLDAQAQEAYERTNISNPLALMGAI